MQYSSETNDLLIAMSENNGLNKSLFPIDVIHRLFDDGFVRYSSDHHDNNLCLTDKGKAYVEEIKSNNKRYKEEIRRSWVRFWIPVAISILALTPPHFVSYFDTLVVKKISSILSAVKQ